MSMPAIYGLIGYPVKHSLSAAMHNAAFKYLNLNAQYHLFEVAPADLEQFLVNDFRVNDNSGCTISSRDILGFNITIPHKIKAKQILENHGLWNRVNQLPQDSLYAELTGAINTVLRVADGFLCFNTDVPGFIRSLKEDLEFIPDNQNVFLLGCGGAGRAAAAGLLEKAAALYIYEQDASAIAAAKQIFSLDKNINKCRFVSRIDKADISICRLLVNATPLGMHEGDNLPIDKSLLTKDLSVYDVVYNRSTELVKAAAKVGAKACGGLGMLLYQGMLAFEKWTNLPAPQAIMRKALIEAMENKL
jgi:shikimate dehydrogenase